jgi:hypothetical protein
MAKWAEWSIDASDDTFMRPVMYRHKTTGGLYRVLHEGLEVTKDEAVPSIVYQNANGDVFIQAKSRFEDGRFEKYER